MGMTKKVRVLTGNLERLEEMGANENFIHAHTHRVICK